MRSETRRQGALALVQEDALRRALSALSDAGLRPLLVKGAALAYTHYPAPHLRPRCDTDLLVHAAERADAAKVLSSLGYVSQNAVEGELVSHQRIFVEKVSHGAGHVIDLHWRLTNPHRFAHLFRHEDLLRESIAIPELGPTARTLGPRHALWLACVHRLAHHAGAERLIWLYDIHLLVTRMSAGEIASFVELAVETGVAGICADGLRAASLLLGTPIPLPVLQHLALAGTGEPDFVPRKPRRWHRIRADLTAMPTWRQRLRLLREHLLPPVDYMLRRHPMTHRIFLPALYLWRAAGAMRKLAQPCTPEPPVRDISTPAAALDS